MRKLFEKDISIKILSVLFAILLWVYVINISNPITTKVVSVPLRYVNEDALKQKGISLKERDYEDVVVTIKGRELQLQSIGESSFQPAILDLAQIESVENNLVPIRSPKYIGKEKIEIISVTPQVKKLELEKLGKKNIDVQVIRTGTVKENYRIVEVVVTPKAIAVEGFESVINQVAQLKCSISYSNLNRDTTFKRVPCTPLNNQGVEIKGVTGNFFADVTIKVAKEVAVVPVIKGTPAENFTVGTSNATPGKVLITGNPDVLDAIDSLATEPVDLDKKSENFSVNRNIVLPQGVNLYNSPREIKVSVNIEPLAEKTFELYSQDIAIVNMRNDTFFEYYVTTPRLIIVVRGEREHIDKLTVSSLKPSVDAAGLEAGNHTLPLKVSLPEGAKLDKKYNVEILIEERYPIKVSPTPAETE